MERNAHYKNGLIKATEHMIKFCQLEIKKIKDSGTKPNTPRQITDGGKFQAYNKMLQKLLEKKKRIQNN